MKKDIPKKKYFLMMDAVRDFMRDKPGEVKKELNGIIWRLETQGVLSAPYGEKISGSDALFAIRVIQAANIRIFYAYGVRDYVFGLHGYVKTAQDIPEKEKRQAERILNQLIKGGFIK